MCSNVVVIASIGSQDSAQMHLAQDNDVVHTLTPDRSDQPFGKAVLPGRGWCGRLVPDAHGAQSARDDAAIDPVAITDEVVRSLIPRKSLRYLTCTPFFPRICCDGCRSAAALPMIVTSSASSCESRPDANGPASRDG